jgi:hypothetical protein
MFELLESSCIFLDRAGGTLELQKRRKEVVFLFKKKKQFLQAI